MDHSDDEILSLFDDTVREWWIRSFGGRERMFTPPQRLAVPMIHAGKSVLISSPTGSGKTLSAFISIINSLFILSRTDGLENSVYCLYISPLRSLANDIHRNLERPLAEIQEIAAERGIEAVEIRHAIRHGDVSSSDRAKMLRKTPHILNTTPESLALLLNSPRFREKLRTVRWVIVDEIHSLAGSKRGVHLSLSLERLEELKRETGGESFVRIGCSATIEPLREVAAFLGGVGREVEIIDTRFSRKFDLRLICPVPDLISTTPGELSRALYETLDELIQSHRNTLVFTNTRNGAERILYNLRARYPDRYNESNSGCHHGSMGKTSRLDVEERLKSGDLRVVTSSTSLELGIDMPHLDLVLQIGSPKSVAALLQRIGRAGHSLDQVVKGRVVVLDRDELIECAVMLGCAREGFVDRIHIPGNCLDVLCQHILGMALERRWRIEDALRIIRRSYCYRDLSEDDLRSVMSYLSGAYADLEERNIYAKIWYDPETGEFGKRGRNSRMIYMLNLGTIPDEFSCDVVTRDGRWVGNLDEKYLERLSKGDVFVLGGRSYAFRYRRGGKIYVDPTGERPTIPSWFSEKLPLSFDLGLRVLQFRAHMLDLIRGADEEVVVQHLLEMLPIDENSARSIYQIFEQQIRYLGEDSVSTDRRIVVEETFSRGRRVYYFMTNYGLKFNDGFSRMVAYLISREGRSNVLVSIADTGFMLSIPEGSRADPIIALRSIRPEMCEDLLRRAVENTNLLKRVFRINATRFFMILRNYMGHRKSARRQQVSADMLIGLAKRLEDFAVLKESYREIVEDKFELDNMKSVVAAINTGDIEIVRKRSPSPGPMAFGIASIGAPDVVLAQDRLALLKEFQRRVMERIAGESAA
ncbi:MAG TPA: ATP-dependent helicase [Methanothrix sp.]|nr:ATP-dependent helicase [Methanothrix sp.]HOK58479.1 ATP-dependent helicase [Methanothrix sp.]HOL43992.1 ATP-dependent helicase [Methanothrix sp.]HPO88784.1 ATP-dependent helicase [Methanothrix sp.]